MHSVLTLAPKLIGGPSDQAPTILKGHLLSAEVCSSLRLLSIYLAGSELFLRYSLSPQSDKPTMKRNLPEEKSGGRKPMFREDRYAGRPLPITQVPPICEDGW